MTLVVMATWAVGTLLVTTIAIYVVAANVSRHEERVLSFPLSVEGSGRGAAQEVGRDVPLLHMIITEPNRFVAEVHDRMPALLRPEQFDAWLDGSAGLGGARPAPEDMLQRR
jgi:putative SOS response-associated peptidase YedK